MHLIGLQLHATKRKWIAALKWPRYSVSSETKAVYAERKPQYTAAGGEFQISLATFTNDGRRNKEIERRIKR